jgi:hypothetical protein
MQQMDARLGTGGTSGAGGGGGVAVRGGIDDFTIKIELEGGI